MLIYSQSMYPAYLPHTTVTKTFLPSLPESVYHAMFSVSNGVSISNVPNKLLVLLTGSSTRSYLLGELCEVNGLYLSTFYSGLARCQKETGPLSIQEGPYYKTKISRTLISFKTSTAFLTMSFAFICPFIIFFKVKTQR